VATGRRCGGRSGTTAGTIAATPWGSTFHRWTGGNGVTGRQADGDRPVAVGMAFHVVSWLIRTRRGGFFVSNTVLAGEGEAEVLIRAPTSIILR
jgi:hypothetical protein